MMRPSGAKRPIIDIAFYRQGLESRRFDARSRQAFRYLLLQGGMEAGLAGDGEGMQAMRQIALDRTLHRPDDWLSTIGALEALPSANAPWQGKCDVTDDPMDPSIAQSLREPASAALGSDLEPKFRFTNLAVENETLRFSMAPTTWTEGRSFHAEFARNPGRFLLHDGRQLVPVPLGDARFPGLAVVHCVVLTSDAKLLLALRGPAVSYAPLHWSISFEEQLTASDVQKGDWALHFAAQRGMIEEFGIMIPLSQIHVISALLQMDNANLGIVVMLQASQSYSDIARSWAGDPKPPHFWEAASLASITADPHELLMLADAGRCPLGPLHPTSPLRCAIVARWLKSQQ